MKHVSRSRVILMFYYRSRIPKDLHKTEKDVKKCLHLYFSFFVLDLPEVKKNFHCVGTSVHHF